MSVLTASGGLPPNPLMNQKTIDIDMAPAKGMECMVCGITAWTILCHSMSGLGMMHTLKIMDKMKDKGVCPECTKDGWKVQQDGRSDSMGPMYQTGVDQ